jgi:hypothetical protein
MDAIFNFTFRPVLNPEENVSRIWLGSRAIPNVMIFDYVYKENLFRRACSICISEHFTSAGIFSFTDYLNFADVVGDYPENLRPERVLNFMEVLAISADKDPRGVEKLKHRIRDKLDFHAALQQEDLETNAIATLRAQMNPKGPQML